MSESDDSDRVNEDAAGLDEGRKRVADVEAQALRNLEFVSAKTHDLRGAMHGILGFTELLHSGKAGPLSPTQLEFLADVLESSRRLLAMVDELGDFAKSARKQLAEGTSPPR